MNPAIRLVRRVADDDARFRLHNWLCSYRFTERAYALLQPKIRGIIVRDDTELVIEGFPRSANTYALAAFRCSNGPDVVVADHLHSATSIREGVRRGIPVLVLIRDPVDACASLIQRQAVRPGTALSAYVAFHTDVEPLLDRAVVCDFETTTSSFATAIRALNARFATSFRPYEATVENETWCREFVIEADRRDQGGDVREHTVALPRPSRDSGRREIVASLLRETSLVAEARARYEAVRSRAVS